MDEAAAQCSLADLAPGQRARIVAVDTDDPGVQRLMVLGLIENTEVEFRHRAIGGDPVEVAFYGSAVSLRRTQARHFKVELLNGDG